MAYDTLVLDSNWQPVGFTGWQNAVKLWYEDRAKIVKEDESGKVLHSASFEMGMPRVIVVQNAWTKRRRMSVPFSRRNILMRDERQCQYCGHEVSLEDYTLDHVMPRSRGGASTWLNLVVACLRCNKHKANKTPAEAGMRLMRLPFEPSAKDPRFNFKLHINKLRPEWKEWSNWLYWNIELEA